MDGSAIFGTSLGMGVLSIKSRFSFGSRNWGMGGMRPFSLLCSGADRGSGQYEYFPPPMNSRSSESFARRSGETSSKRSNAGRMLCSSL